MTLPGAIIVAGALVAVALIWISRPAAAPGAASNGNDIQSTASSMAPVTAADHILGNPNAPIKLVEYSDPSCPYCKTFNPTMEAIMTGYGPGGKVVWVYRQFPLDKPDETGNIFHPNSGKEATAFECAGALGGTTVFFAYEKRWFEAFPLDGASRTASADQAQIAQTAEDVGLDPVSFNECLSSGRFKDKLDKSYTDGLNAGVAGTPYTVIITPSGTNLPPVGAISYSTLKTVIDTLISSIPASSATTTAQ
jgi:protein-disulfide isomerase